jgi:hypothetical protein
VHFLSMAAANSAEVERLALGAGMKKGGAAKGELVLAMYELANCFRNGWGIKKDAAAAKHYYETAANLGDTDAMNEVAWCYIEGFGTKKDKVRRDVSVSPAGSPQGPDSTCRLAPCSVASSLAAASAADCLSLSRAGLSETRAWLVQPHLLGSIVADGDDGGHDDGDDDDDDDDDDADTDDGGGGDGTAGGANAGMQFKAAQFLRLAESKGNKTLGNTW